MYGGLGARGPVVGGSVGEGGAVAGGVAEAGAGAADGGWPAVVWEAGTGRDAASGGVLGWRGGRWDIFREEEARAAGEGDLHNDDDNDLRKQCTHTRKASIRGGSDSRKSMKGTRVPQTMNKVALKGKHSHSSSINQPTLTLKPGRVYIVHDLT